MSVVAVSLFLFLIFCVLGVSFSIILNLKERLAGCCSLQWMFVSILVLVFAVFLLRSHEDTFAGLDNSGYRLMARAFQAGRSIHSVDKVLLDVPFEIRNRVMLLQAMDERNTRDRSFLVKSLYTGETEPFFYPLLPLCAAGFDALVPGNALDYLVPVIGLLFAVIFLLVGMAYGGWLGVLFAAALLVGSPLPAWLLRGFYVESVASVLLALALIDWLTCPGGRRVSLFAYLALGLAISFHPAMIVISLPLLMMFALSREERLRDVVMGFLLFGAGSSVMIGMLMYACSPYGNLSWPTLQHNFTVSASHRITLACAGGIALVTIVAVLAKPAWSGWYRRLSENGKYIVTCIPLVLSILPILIAVVVWSQKTFVCGGLIEAGSAVRFWLGSVLVGAGLYVFISRQNARARMALTVAFLAVPVFTYLKGAEQMGLWSQRRMLPVYLILITGILPATASWLQSLLKNIPRPANLMAGAAIIIVLLLAGGSNPCRWPAPYTVRCDRGAWDWVEKIRAKIGDRLVFFDYYPYSVPFAVTGKTRALGLNEGAYGKVDEIMTWLSEKAEKEQVLIASAFENPGMEENTMLEPSFVESIQLGKVVSKGALPAERKAHTVKIQVLNVRPVGTNGPLPVLNKVLDNGPLALRGPWGKGRPIKVDGKMLPARWSREGSGVIGPVPLPGQTVQISMECAADRDDKVVGQVLQIKPPWGTAALSLAVSNEFTRVSGYILRPLDQPDDGKRTGIYRIHAEKPYDPAKAGIKGYENDLGARIHLIRIEAVKANSVDPSG